MSHLFLLIIILSIAFFWLTHDFVLAFVAFLLLVLVISVLKKVIEFLSHP